METVTTAHCWISKLPAEAKLMDLFYACLLERTKGDDETWYYKKPVRHNELLKMVSNMCTLPEIPGHHTNHSLCATGALYSWCSGKVNSRVDWAPVN